MQLNIYALDHIVLNVTDVEASAGWYTSVLGVERKDFDPGHNKPLRTSIKSGQQKINLRRSRPTRSSVSPPTMRKPAATISAF